MVSGERRNDLALMQAGRGDWVTKIGAEGVQADRHPQPGFGIAIKVADGQKRGLHPAIVARSTQLGLLDATARTDARAMARTGGPQLPRPRNGRSPSGRCSATTVTAPRFPGA